MYHRVGYEEELTISCEARTLLLYMYRLATPEAVFIGRIGKFNGGTYKQTWGSRPNVQFSALLTSDILYAPQIWMSLDIMLNCGILIRILW